MLDLLKLKTFRTVALKKNFTRAAAELGYSQSNVTTHIKSLEQELGAPLFNRFRFANRIVLTEAGRRIFEYAGQLLALADETKAAVRQEGEPSGPLRVSAPESLLGYRLPSLLYRFQTSYPKVELDLIAGLGKQAAEALLEGEADLAFVLDEPARPGRVIGECLKREEMIVAASPDNPSASSVGISLAELFRSQDLLIEKNNIHNVLIDHVMSPAQARKCRMVDVGTLEAVKRCAMTGLGVAVLPRGFITEELERGQLVPLQWTGEAPAVYTQMLHSREQWASPTLRAFWNLAREEFSRA
jgi:DNA-binding transcriptional LysR family regulator